MINDVSASLWPVAASRGVGWVAMHRKGTPATMQQDPRYDDVVGEVSALLVERAARANRAGVAEVWIDPGIGFGKTVDHNLALLRSLADLVATGYPVMVGTSRKSFLASVATRRGLAGAGRRAPPGVRWPRRPGPWPRGPAWCASTMSPPPSRPRCWWGRWAAGRRSEGSTRAADHSPGPPSSRRWERERQVGGGDPSPQLHLGDQGPAGHERASGRLRPQPPQGPAPGGDHLAAGPGVHPGGLAAALLPQPAGLRGAVDGQRALPPPARRR